MSRCSNLCAWLKVALCFVAAFLLTLVTWLLISNLYAVPTSHSTTPPSPTSPPPPQTTIEPPLDCQNGGSYIHELKSCLCPDQWKGLLCNETNYCNASEYTFRDGNVSFPSVLGGRYINSEEVCPMGTKNGGLPRATRFCSESLILSTPVALICGENLQDLLKKIQSDQSEETVLNVASSTQIITSKPDTLKEANIYSAAEIVIQTLNNTQFANNTEVANAAVSTVSQLLQAPEDEFRKTGNNVTQSLTRKMEEFSLEGNNINQNYISVQSVELLPDSSTGVLFTALKVDENNASDFVFNSINVESNVSQFVLNPNSEVQLFINATGNITSAIRVGFVLYQNDKFFRSKLFKSKQNFSRKIISGNIPSKNVYNVELAIRRQDTSRFTLHDFACVYWNYSQEDWDTTGCEKIFDDTGFLKCICNHTTNFALLMSFRQNYMYSQPLEIVSIIGCVLSITGLTVTIIFQLFNWGIKTHRSSVVWPLVSLCTSMLIFNIIFISGVENKNGAIDRNNTEEYLNQDNSVPKDDIVNPKNDWCTAVAVLLHYFLLTTFAWTAIIAATMYIRFIRIFTVTPRHFTLIMLATGWGVPAIIVAITFGATYPFDAMNYRQEEFCWLAALNEKQEFDMRKPMLWAFLLPVGLILIFNIFIFIYVTILRICKDNKKLNSTRKNSYIKKVVHTLSIAVMLGITWAFGYLLLINNGPMADVFSFVFCFLNATQGLQMFVLYTLKSPIFLKQVTKLFNKLSVPRIYIHSDKYHMIKNQHNTTNEFYKLHETMMDWVVYTLSTTDTTEMPSQPKE